MYDNEHGRYIKNIIDDILERNVRHEDSVEEAPFGGVSNGGDEINFDEINPDTYHKALVGRTIGGMKPKKSVALYEPVDEATFEGEGAPIGNKNAKNWISHVQAYRTKHKCSYKDALKGAKSSYTKGSKPVKKEVKKPELEPVEPRRGTRERKPKFKGGALLLREQMKPTSMFGGKRTSSWIQHIQSYSKTHGVSYKEAMSLAKKTYKK